MPKTKTELERLNFRLAEVLLGEGVPGFQPATNWYCLGLLLTMPSVTRLDPRIEWNDEDGIWTFKIERGGLLQATRYDLPFAVCAAVAKAFKIDWENPA